MDTAYRSGNFLDRLCLNKYHEVSDHKIVAYCLKYNLLEDVAGGCGELFGTYNSTDLFYALKRCKIK